MTGWMNRKGRPWGRKFSWGRGRRERSQSQAGRESFYIKDQVEKEEGGRRAAQESRRKCGEMGGEPGEDITGTKRRRQFRKEGGSSCEESSRVTKAAGVGSVSVHCRSRHTGQG